MPFFVNNDVHIYYECWSYPVARHTITLINGYGRPCTDFRSLGKALVRAGFKVITLDNRAVGRSSVTSPFTLDDMCADVVAIWEHLEITSSALLGISMGGAVAQLLALDFPAKVTRLVLVSSFCDNSFALLRDKRRWDSQAAVLETLQHYVAADFSHNNRALLAAMAKQMWQQRHNAGSGASLQDKAISGFSSRARLAEFSCPTLIVHGAEDRVIDPQAAEVFAQMIPTAELCLLPQAGHLLLIEKAVELRTRVIDFCVR